MKKIKSLIILVALFFLPLLSFARTYNHDNLISDRDYTDSGSMSANHIQEFLKAKGSELASIRVDVYGKMKRVADIFYEKAREYGISQKLLLVTAQKEQSAITDGSLSEDQKNILMGYGVYPGNDYTKYLGIFNQIDYAAWQFKDYIERPHLYNFRFGAVTWSSDGYKISPYNSATAGLYNYTPHAGAPTGTSDQEDGNGGNFLFWKIWNQWFSSVHPDGTLVRETGTPGVYYIINGKKRPFWSATVFKQYKFDQDDVIEVSTNEIQGYSTMMPMKYPNGTLIKDPNTGGIYIVEHNKVRPFASRQALESRGYDVGNAKSIDEFSLSLYEKGAPITEENISLATGTLVRHPKFGGIYYIDNGYKRPITHKLIFDNQFYNEEVIDISYDQLKQYPDGAPILFKDGSLLRDESGNIFVIEKGKRRHIERPSIFNGLGYQSYNIINVPNNIILLHPGGEPIVDY